MPKDRGMSALGLHCLIYVAMPGREARRGERGRPGPSLQFIANRRRGITFVDPTLQFSRENRKFFNKIACEIIFCHTVLFLHL